MAVKTVEKKTLNELSDAESRIAEISKSLNNRMNAGHLSACPLEFSKAFIEACGSQSCGKCTPCRIGLKQMAKIFGEILDGEGDKRKLDILRNLATTIYETADCAIGFEAGRQVLEGLKNFEDDFSYHLRHDGNCKYEKGAHVPCTSRCPANVDVPGYIACAQAGKYTDAVKVIRKDNPFALACGLICERPCEINCRRNMIDRTVNIRGIKRYAAEHAKSYTPFHYKKTGKKVAIIGGGPSGLTCAYYLALMGHEPTIYEQRAQLGGMMRYGIPAYRFPRAEMDKEIDFLLKQGIKVKLNTSVPKDISMAQLKKKHDAIYLAIGAHDSKGLHIPGEHAEGVLSAVQMLRAIGDGHTLDFRGQEVVVVGGGNVAMDCARTAKRLGSDTVTIAYRRRKRDVTALEEELDAALEEGCFLRELNAPVEVVTNDDKVIGLKLQPQVCGLIERGRPKPIPSTKKPSILKADKIIVAIGQDIDSKAFGKFGIKVNRGKLISNEFTEALDKSGKPMKGVFVGGDCQTGPATVIKAVAAGKVAARNIDTYLGYDHPIKLDVKIPAAKVGDKLPAGRIKMMARHPSIRKHDFESFEIGMNQQELQLECNRCLRCDHYGIGSFRGGRSEQW